MTLYDMKCSSQILSQITSEVGKLEVLQTCRKLLAASKLLTTFSAANVIGMIVSCSET